jgi:phosphotransferase system enzyme I (PtsI)
MSQKGIAASEGVAIAKALVLKAETIEFNESPAEDSKAEIDRFRAGRSKTSTQLQAIKDNALKTMGEEKAEIFGGHIMMLEDEELENEVVELINEGMRAELAAKNVFEMMAQMWESNDDPYLKERGADMRDIGDRLVRNILGKEIISLSGITEPTVLVAEDLTPSETAQINVEFVKGFITDKGGRTAHTSIMARSLEIPAIVALGDITQRVKTGDTVIVNAIANNIVINPSDQERQAGEQAMAAFQADKAELAKLRDLPAETLDGHKVEVCANIGTPKDVEGALRNGAEGVGLFRSEFLYMDSPELPSEEVQYAAYRQVLEAMGNRFVIIRTMDIGGDKDLPYLDIPEEENPFLGYRAIRICLDRPDIFDAQLRALLRASAHGNLGIMFPFVISVREVTALKAAVEKNKAALDAEGIKRGDPKIGIMIETPASVAIADHLIKDLDFFSIGTNDLTQYTLAVDRGNKQIADLYEPMSPAVLRFIKQTIDASHADGKWTGMCGEFAGDERAALVLCGMGLDEFSMSSVSIPKIKRLLRQCKQSDLQALAERVLAAPTLAGVNAEIDAFLESMSDTEASSAADTKCSGGSIFSRLFGSKK